MTEKDLTPDQRQVVQAMEDLTRHGRGEILIVITPGVVDILAGKRNRFEKGVDTGRKTV